MWSCETALLPDNHYYYRTQLPDNTPFHIWFGLNRLLAYVAVETGTHEPVVMTVHNTNTPLPSTTFFSNSKTIVAAIFHLKT